MNTVQMQQIDGMQVTHIAKIKITGRTRTGMPIKKNMWLASAWKTGESKIVGVEPCDDPKQRTIAALIYKRIDSRSIVLQAR